MPLPYLAKLALDLLGIACAAVIGAIVLAALILMGLRATAGALAYLDDDLDDVVDEDPRLETTPLETR